MPVFRRDEHRLSAVQGKYTIPKQKTRKKVSEIILTKKETHHLGLQRRISNCTLKGGQTMLRTFRRGMSFSLVRADRYSLVRAGRQILIFAVMFVLCRVRPVPGLAPFAAAFFAGAFSAGKSCGALVAGSLLGSVGNMSKAVELSVPAGAAIVLGGGLVWDSLRCRFRLGTSPPGKRSLFSCGMLAGFGVLLPGLVAAEGLLWPSLQTVFCAVAAAAAAPFMQVALEIRGMRRFLTKEERIGMMLILCGVGAGFMDIYRPIAAGFGVLTVLTLYASGSLVAIAIGGTMMLAGCDARLPGILCIGGLCAQLLSDECRICRAGAVMLSVFAGGLFLQTNPGIITGAVLGAGLYAALPEKWVVLPGSLARPVQAAFDPDRLAVQLMGQTSKRISALSDAFGELAECYLTPCTGADEQMLIGRMRERLCTGCPGYGQCWDSGSGAARFLCGLVSDAVAWAAQGGEGDLFEDDMPPDVLRMCRRGRFVPERLGNMLSDFALCRQNEKRRNSENRLISAQFMQAQQLLDGVAREQMKPIRLRNRQSARAAAILEGMGIPLREVLMISQPRAEMIAVLREGRWTREMANAASVQLTKSFGRLYSPEGEPGREMRFVRSPNYYADTGACCISRDAGVPSGDSHLIKMIDNERILILISDGMGSGEAAARESAAAVKLLAKFISAGVEYPLAIETVNAMLLNRSGEDMFATVDMLILNLTTGTAEFIKLAGCPSLIIRQDEIYRVEGGRLPLGILEKVQPAVTRMQLQPGDIVLMGSDGVMDAVDADDFYQDLQEGTENMPDMAQRVLTLAENNRQRGRRDDMTAVCIRVNARDNFAEAV